MKNLKNMLGLMIVPTLSLVGMVTVSADAVDFKKETHCVDSEAEVCVLNAAVKLKEADLTKSMSFKTTSGKNIVLTEDGGDGYTIPRGVTLTIDGGYLDMAKLTKIIVPTGATLIIKNGADAALTGTSAVKLEVTGGTVTFEDNNTTFGKTATVTVSNSGVLNIKGSTTTTEAALTVENATVNVSGSKATGLKGVIKLNADAKLNVTGNAYNGVELSSGSTIAQYATLTANGNSTSSATDKYNKGDIVLAADMGTMNGTLIGGSITTDMGKGGTGEDRTITLSSTSKVTLSSINGICDASGVISCNEEADSYETVKFSGNGVATVAGEAHVYGTHADAVAFDASVKTVVIEKNADVKKGITVAPGTTVVNKSSKMISATPTGSSTAVAVNGTEDDKKPVSVVVGTASSTGSQEPGSQEPGQAGPGDDEPSKSPATFDAIGSLVTMAISSLGVVGTATKKLFR